MSERSKPTKIDFSKPHKSKGSKLMPFINELRLARSNRWPLRDIQSWLENEHELKVSLSNLGAFCARYNLNKGGVRTEKTGGQIVATKSNRKVSSSPKKQGQKKFSFGKKEQGNFKKRVTGE